LRTAPYGACASKVEPSSAWRPQVGWLRVFARPPRRPAGNLCGGYYRGGSAWDNRTI